MSVYIIAEAGVNHNGNIELAQRMIDAAKESGADCIKFQTYKTDNLVTNQARKAKYQCSTSNDEFQMEMLKRLELPYDYFLSLKTYCDQVGITFLSSPFDIESVAFLKTIDMPFWKIPSGEVTDYPYLVSIAKTKKPVVMSTGMCNIEEIQSALDVLKEFGTEDIKLLHCNTEYPTPFEDVNLKTIQTLRDYFSLKIGYSDHTDGVEAPIAAVTLGACIIEKHFTLDKHMDGPDHKASLEPQEFATMVTCIRNIEKALGTGIKEPTPSEKKNIDAVRKSIVARKDIMSGEIFTEKNLTVKRPGTGVSPMKWLDIIGTVASIDYHKDDMIVL